MKIMSLILLLAISSLAFGQAMKRGPHIHTFTSQTKDDEVNSHLIETPGGVIVVDAQRLFSETHRLVAEIRKIGKPMLGVLITHSHSDHYGGLSVLMNAAPPDTPIIASARTLEAMKTLNREAHLRRSQQFGADYPTQAQIDAFLPNRLVRDGERFTLGGLTFEVMELPDSEAHMTTLYHLPQQRAAFPGDLINNHVHSAPFESIDQWIAQLDQIKQRLPRLKTVYLGHGATGAANQLIREQRAYLVRFRALIQTELQRGDGQINAAARDRIFAALEADYPGYTGAAAMPPRTLIPQMIERITVQWQKEKHQH
jgi:glyoxylase-like metal-dependent hydrolase (beta-lactamase superfamily II)